jgi:hypothetical protein
MLRAMAAAVDAQIASQGFATVKTPGAAGLAPMHPTRHPR